MKIIKPMLLSSYDGPFTDENWMFSPKFDGIRLLVGENYSYTRHGTITTNRFPELKFDIGFPILLDGELIAPGTDAPDDFAAAMSRFSGNMNQPIQFLAFDILSYKGESVMFNPIEERKALLTEVIAKIDSSIILLTPLVYEEGDVVFEVVKANNMEGMVAYKRGSIYKTAHRSNDWKKIIYWRYSSAVVTKITFNPLTVQLHSVTGDYLGSMQIGFTKVLKQKLLANKPPYLCQVKSRGWTSSGKLRLPQIIEIEL